MSAVSTNRTMFHHCRRPGAGKKEFTVAIRRNGNQVDFGFAYCSGRDNFNKRIGRLIAEGRLEKHPISVPVVEFGSADPEANVLIKYAIETHTAMTGTE